MRHAAPTKRWPLSRAGQITLAAGIYAITGLTTGLVALGSTLAVWALWQWLGVN